MFATLERTEENVKETNVMTLNRVETASKSDENGKKGIEMLYASAARPQAYQIPTESPKKEVSDEDICPTDTTMQFAEKDMFKTYYKEQSNQSEDVDYHKNTHGKIMLVLYSVAVGIILALIIMNSSVLSTMTKNNESKKSQVIAMTEQYNSVKAELDEISSDSHVINVAEQEYNMVK